MLRVRVEVTGITEGGFEKKLGDIGHDFPAEPRHETAVLDSHTAGVETDYDNGSLLLHVDQLPKELAVIKLRIWSY